MFTSRSILLGCLLLLAALVSVLISLASGSVAIPLGELLTPSDPIHYQILHELRLPRTLAAFATGAMLAVAGVIMQVLLRNPLADPYILGISGGAAAAALTSILLGAAGMWVPQAALLGALASIALVFGVAGLGSNRSVTRLLLTGVVVSAGWGAIINILLTASATNTVQSMLFWLMGDLSQSRPGLWHAVILVAGCLVVGASARSLNVMLRGDQQAMALGIDLRVMRGLLFITASLLTASAVTMAGSIGFVGLVIPHTLRLLGARDHRLLLPYSFLLGGSFLVLADCLARTVIAPQQLPVGVVTAVIGVPVFLLILRRTLVLAP
ncbi:MAG: hypothetical protein RLZZ385_908 [Pseudomonadota bacterium]